MAQQERTEWHNIVVWGKQAETCGEYLSKGRQVYIEGRIQTRKVEDKEGNDRYFTDINAQQVKFLGSGRAAQDGDEGAGAVPPDDDVPF